MVKKAKKNWEATIRVQPFTLPNKTMRRLKGLKTPE
jgi:hypothetical protein